VVLKKFEKISLEPTDSAVRQPEHCAQGDVNVLMAEADDAMRPALPKPVAPSPGAPLDSGMIASRR